MKGDRRGPTLPGAAVHCANCRRFVDYLIDQGDGRFRCIHCDGRPDAFPYPGHALTCDAFVLTHGRCTCGLTTRGRP